MSAQGEVAPTWGIALRIWWAITWRGFLFSMIPVFLLTIPVSIVFLILERVAGLSQAVTNGISQLTGMLIGFSVQIYVIKKILNKNFKDFSLIITASRSSKAPVTMTQQSELSSSSAQVGS